MDRQHVMGFILVPNKTANDGGTDTLSGHED